MSAISGPVREAAQNLTRVLASTDNDPSKDTAGAKTALGPLVGKHDELYAQGLERPVAFMSLSRVAYFDPGLTFILSSDAPGFKETPHNHGIWNVLLISSGSMRFTWYRRIDDGGRPGFCDLRVADERILRPGDVGVVGSPPHDIHEFEILEEDTWLFTAAPGRASKTRQFYDLSSRTYVEKALFEAESPQT